MNPQDAYKDVNRWNDQSIIEVVTWHQINQQLLNYCTGVAVIVSALSRRAMS